MAPVARGARRLLGRASWSRPDDGRRGVRPAAPRADRRVHPARRVPPVLLVRPDALAVARAIDAAGDRRGVRARPSPGELADVRPQQPRRRADRHPPRHAGRHAAPTRGPAATCTTTRRPVDLAVGTRRARAAAGLLLGLPGAVYLYQGEELGLPEVLDLPDEAPPGPHVLPHGRTRGRAATAAASRCRGPRARTARTGSRRTGSAAPWLPQPADWGRYALDRQVGDESSMLALYRRLIAARRDMLAGTGRRTARHRRRRRRRSAAATSSSRATSARSRARSPRPPGSSPSSRRPGRRVDGAAVPGDTTVWFSPRPASSR